MKFCSKCKTEKPVGEFYVYKSGNRSGELITPCRACVLETSANYVAIPENRKRKSERAAANYAIPENKKRILERNNKFNAIPENRKRKSEYDVEYYAIPENRKNKTEYAAIPENKKRRNERMAERLRTDIRFKIIKNLRTRTRMAIKNGAKSGSGVRDLGCTVDEFIAHLESQFQPGMTWENYGRHSWHIDHIKPLYLLNKDPNNRALYLELAHYTNQQPLWAKDNLSKGTKY